MGNTYDVTDIMALKPRQNFMATKANSPRKTILTCGQACLNHFTRMSPILRKRYWESVFEPDQALVTTGASR